MSLTLPRRVFLVCFRCVPPRKVMNLENKAVCFLGKLAAYNRKEATRFVSKNGGKIAKTLDVDVQILVVGEGDILAQDWNEWNNQLDAATRESFEKGTLEIIPESRFWDIYNPDEIGLKEQTETLYTPSMLAELSGLSLAVIRQLERKCFIVPYRQIHKLSYFRFDVLAVLKTSRCLLNAGLSLQKTITRLQKIPPHCLKNPVAVRGKNKEILYRTKIGIANLSGQIHFPFILEENTDSGGDSLDRKLHGEPLDVLNSVFEPELEPNNPAALCEAAWVSESEGNLTGAVQLYRTALAAGGPNAQINFQLAELFYRLGELSAARERYFSAIEIDETFVEARANLGCVLAEQGDDELAAAAFRGALRFHPDYAEVHYHLGQVLHHNGLTEEAQEHFQLFLELMPDSPWAERIPT